MNTIYEKPTMKMVPLRGNKNIANTCWGNHSENTQRYFDSAGKGYVGFYVSGGNCGLTEDSLVVNYYDHKGATTFERVYKGNDAFDELYKKLVASGGATGNPFDGEEHFPDNPGGMS